MQRFLQCLWCVALLLLPSMGATQSWSPVAAQFGNGYGICDSVNGAQNCLILRCDAERGVQFSFISSQSVPQRAVGILRVDGGAPETVSWRASGRPGELAYNHGSFHHGALMVQMATGQRLTVALHRRFDFPLTGARAAIDHVIATCRNRENARFASFADLKDKVLEAPDDRAPTDSYLAYLHDRMAQGPVIDTSQSNPALRGVDRAGCIAQCLGRGDCLVAAYDDARGLCSLQGDLGPMEVRQGALSTLIQQRPRVVRRPQLPGPGPVEAEGLRWKPGEDLRGYVRRKRDAAMPMGQDCQAEANEMARFARGLDLTPPPEVAVAGDPIALSWTSRRLAQRIPAWMIVSVDRPARFGGSGFYALNPGAIGPFGVETDADRQRAFAPVYAEKGVDGGKIGIVPLEAGPYEVRVTLLSYLRKCQQELPLAQMVFRVGVSPAAPQIVLRDITAGHPFDRRIEVPEFSRRIELNDTRFLIQNLSDGSEILSREGKNLRLSPTRRYIAIHDDAHYDIFDIVDGKKVARVQGTMLAFWNADSFFVSDESYWGQISLGSPLLERVHFRDHRTGSGCCFNRGGGGLMVDLENNFIYVQGRLDPGRSDGKSLLSNTALGRGKRQDLTPRNASSLGKSVSDVFANTLDSVAPLAPLDRWDTPLGPIYIHTDAHMPIRDPDQPDAAAILAMVQPEPVVLRNPDFGKGVRAVSASLPQMSILRGMAEPLSTGAQAGFEQAMSRAGIVLAQARMGQLMFRETDTQAFDGNETLKLRDPVYQEAVRQLIKDVGQSGKGLEWSRYEAEDGFPRDTWCETFPTSTPEESDAKESMRRLSSDNIDLAYRFDLGTRAVWISRAMCFRGATGASASTITTLNIFDTDFSARWHAEHRVAASFKGGATLGQGTLETDFDVKLFNDNLLVTYAPGKGALMVFDLGAREFRLKLPYARRGDLLADVFVDAGGRHLFQLNTDGSFTTYRLTDGAAVLEGRYLDDELVVWTADFHFDATEEGAAFVELRFPGQAGQFSFQQFDGALRVPGLFRTVLSGGVLPVPKTVGVPPRMEGRVQAKAGRINGLALADGARPIKAVRLFQDGVLTDSFEPLPGQLIPVDASRGRGVRWATLVAEDVDGLVSLPLNVDLGADPAGLPRTHFFGVGVDYYADTRLEPLNYGKLDAVRMADTFAALDGHTASVVTNTLLTDRRASLEGIPAAIDRLLASAQAGDHVVLFFAGHGLQDPDGQFYFGLSATDLDALPATALNWQDLSRRFAGKGVRITVLLDACHAGAADTQAFATNDAAVAGLTKALSGSMTVLSAAKGRQFSGESAAVGGGYFTEAIRDVLLDSRAAFDENRNGILEVVEFYRGVKTRVVQKRGAAQTPWLSRNQLVGEYGLF